MVKSEPPHVGCCGFNYLKSGKGGVTAWSKKRFVPDSYWRSRKNVVASVGWLVTKL